MLIANFTLDSLREGGKVKRELNRLLKLMPKIKNYKAFEIEVMKRLHWYIGEGDTRLKIDTKEDLLRLYQFLGGK
jgi:hypothetical protein